MFTVNSFSRIVCRSFMLASLATAAFAAQPIVKTVPWVAADSSVPHDSVAFKAVTLKGTSSLQGANIRATWDFGDGSPAVSSAVTNAYDVSTTHAYSGVAGTTYNARLTVSDLSTGEYSFADYPVAVRDATLDVLVNVAIDEGLWYLHRSMNRTSTSGDWMGTACFACDVTGEATAWNLLAFERQGHLAIGDAANPYTETVARAHAAVAVQMTAQQPKGAVFARAAGIAAQADTQASPSSLADTASAVAAADPGTLVARQNLQGFWLGNNPVAAASFETGQALFALTATPVRLAGVNSVTNVSSQVLVTNTGFTFNRATGTYSGNLTVKNITVSTTIAGPITVGITNFPAGVTLTNSNGTFNGAPYRSITPSQLLPGASVTVPIVFLNPSNTPITFNRFTYSGNFPPAALTLACPANTGQVGVNYSSTPDANGGVLTYSFAVTVGTLPGGLNINATTGEISGSPTTSGTVNFTVTVTDSAGQNGQTASQPCSINIGNPGPPDLTVTKSHTGDFVAGSTGNTYTVIVTNSGTGDKAAGQSVSVTDAAPSGLVVTAMSGGGWICTTLPTCTRNDLLAPAASYPAITVTVTVDPAATSPKVNSVTVTTAATESNAGNNTATDSTVITPAPQPDLTISKSHTGSFVTGSTGNTYTVTVTNSGTGDKAAGQSVSVTDAAPSGLVVTAMSGGGWTCTTLPTCTRNDVLAPAASYPAITVTVTVDPAATSPKVNSISVTTAATESNAGNNTATDSTVITPAPQPDLTISKGHTGNFTQGSTGNYTVIVTNSGTGDKAAGQSVSVTDAAPSGLVVTAMSGGGWTCTTLPTCTRNDVLVPAASYPAITVTVSVDPVATSPKVNSVSVTTAATESNAGNNTATDSTVIVAPPNVAPSFTKGPDKTVLEDAGPQSFNPWATAISAGPPAESGQLLTFNITGNTNSALFSAGPAVASNGTLTFTPAANLSGTATITLTLSDNGGTANGGVDTSAPQSFIINVTAVNDPPSFTKGPDETVLEDSGAHTVNPWATAISPGPADESGQAVTFNITGNSTPALFSAGPAISPAGVLTYTLAANQFGSATINITLSDDGTPNATSAVQQFVINVTNVNDAPSFTKGADQTVNEDAGAQTVNPWATAISAGPNESGQVLTFVVTGNTNTGLFSAGPSVSAAGVLTYTPAANQNGTATITLKITDNGGTANGGIDESATQSFVITVNAVNDPPTLAAKNYTAHANMPISFGAGVGLLTGTADANDNGVNGCVSTTFTITPGSISVTAPLGGVVAAIADGSFTFTPPPGFTGGNATFTYTVTDTGCPGPGLASAPATVTVAVSGPVIWFVDGSAAGNDSNTGVLGAPFKTMGKATTVIGISTNHRIFAYSNTYTQGAALNSGGWLIGQPVTGASFDAVMAITPPTGTLARPAVATGTVTLQNTVQLNASAVVKGLILNTSANPGINDPAGAITGVTVAEVAVTSTTGTAVNLTNADGSFTFKSVSSSGASNGIVWNNSSPTTGSFTVLGSSAGHCGGIATGFPVAVTAPDSADCSGGTIQGSTATGIVLVNANNVSLTRMRVTGSADDGISGSHVVGFSLNSSHIENNGNAIGDNGIDFGDGGGGYSSGFTGMLGTSNITNSTVTGSLENNVLIRSKDTPPLEVSPLNLTVAGSAIRNNSTANGSDGILIEAAESSNMTINVSGSAFIANRGDHFQATGLNTGIMNATFTANTLTGGNAGALGQGITIFPATGVPGYAGSMTYDINGNSINGAILNAITVNLGTSSAAATMSGKIRNNLIGTTGSALSCSTQGNGIEVDAHGNGTHTMSITGNTIKRCFDRGVLVLANDGSGVLNMTVTGNVINELADTNGGTGTPREAFNMVTGAADPNLFGVPDAHTVCLTVTSTSGNMVGGAFKTGDIRIRQRFRTRVNMPGYGGTAFDTSAVNTFLQGANPGTTATSSANNDAGVTTDGFFGGAACTLP